MGWQRDAILRRRKRGGGLSTVCREGAQHFCRAGLEPSRGDCVRFLRYLTKHGGRPMDTSERFLRFAAECELMAKFTRDRENKTVWRSIAQRWIRCAELVERQNSSALAAHSMKHRGKAAFTLAH